MKICVLMGGDGSEAEVSRRSASSVMRALSALDIAYVPLEFTAGYLHQIQQLNVDFTYIAMHGTQGEDGAVQAGLESIGMPYNGSGVKASALAMDKAASKKVLAAAGVPVIDGFVCRPEALPKRAADVQFPVPFVIKPNADGSSVGVFIVASEEDYIKACTYFSNTGQDVLVEEYIPGREMTVGIMGDKALCVTEVTNPTGTFYDYTSKYSSGGSIHICPAKIATDVQQKFERIALVAHNSLGCAGLSRVDFRYDETNNRIVVLEVNTLPGFTPTSLLPEMAEACGFSFSDLVQWSINEGLCRTDYTAADNTDAEGFHRAL